MKRLLVVLIIASIFLGVCGCSSPPPGGGSTVYITETGSKYHAYGCKYLRCVEDRC